MISTMMAHKKTVHHFSALLSTTSSLYTTSCAVQETEFCSVVRRIKALKIIIIGCNHEGKIKGADCILSFTEGGNESGYFVGTSDEELVARLQQLPFVPVIQCFGSRLCLRKPSDIQMQYAEEEENVEGANLGDRRGGGLYGVRYEPFFISFRSLHINST